VDDPRRGHQRARAGVTKGRMYPARMSRATLSPGRLTVTESCVLGLLVAKEQSGYDLNRSAQQSVGLIYAPAKSRIYAVLPRLLKRRLVTRREVPQRTRPDKFVYRITPAGRRALREWLNDTSQPLSRPLLLLKVFFGSEADPDALAEQLLRRREEIASELETLRELGRKRKDVHDDELMLFPNLTLDWGLAIDPIELEWIDRTLERIATLRPAETGKTPRRRAPTPAGRGG
jgi:PadR family transcriptional regulator, regulatory protein AphA